MTLIEVVAALAIIGSLLVGVVMARARLTHQWSQANRLVQVTDAVDALLNRWLGGGATSIPIDETGTLENLPTVHWQTHALQNGALKIWKTRIIRLTVTDEDRPQPILTVDLAAPIVDKAQKNTPES